MSTQIESAAHAAAESLAQQVIAPAIKSHLHDVLSEYSAALVAQNELALRTQSEMHEQALAQTQRQMIALSQELEAIRKAMEPVTDWYSGEEHNVPLANQVADAVRDLQTDRSELLKLDSHKAESLKAQLDAAQPRLEALDRTMTQMVMLREALVAHDKFKRAVPSDLDAAAAEWKALSDATASVLNNTVALGTLQVVSRAHVALVLDALQSAEDQLITARNMFGVEVQGPLAKIRLAEPLLAQ